MKVSGAWELRQPSGLLATLRKVSAVARVTVGVELRYVGAMVVNASFILLVFYVMSQVWRTMGRSHDVTAMTGFNFTQLIWYLVATEAMVSTKDGSELQLDEEIRSGDIAYRLVRPLPYWLYVLGEEVADRFYRLAFYLALCSAAALALAGPLQMSLTQLLLGIGAMASAALVSLIYTFCLSLVSFWVEDSYGLHLLWSRVQMIFGGLLVPLEAYPHWLRRICDALPFAQLVYGPARVFVRGETDFALHLFRQQAIFAAVGLLPLVILYRAGMRRLNAQGG